MTASHLFRIVDKIGVKDYVSRIIGSEYVIETLGTWDKTEDIKFELLPNRFVQQWNNGSGSLLMCKNKKKFDYKQVVAFFKES